VEAAGHCFTAEDLLSIETRILRDVLDYEIPLLSTRYYFLVQFISLINTQAQPGASGGLGMGMGLGLATSTITPRHSNSKSPDSVVEGAHAMEAEVEAALLLTNAALYNNNGTGTGLAFTPSPKTPGNGHRVGYAIDTISVSCLLSDKEVEFAHYISMLVLQMGFNTNYYPMSLVTAAIIHYTRQVC